MNIDEKMEMVMANEEVKNLSYKEKRAARPAFFCPTACFCDTIQPFLRHFVADS